MLEFSVNGYVKPDGTWSFTILTPDGVDVTVGNVIDALLVPVLAQLTPQRDALVPHQGVATPE